MDITTNKNIVKAGMEKESLDFIFENCFKSGFGTLNKTEIDLILFAAILKFSEDVNHSDHKLSKYLQITQQRVRNLKEKASVKYLAMSREDAVDIFVEKCDMAKLDGSYIDVPVNDVAVKNEIEALLDELDILLHSQLNPKIFRIRIDDFLELIIQVEVMADPSVKKSSIEKRIIKKIKANAKSDNNLKEAIEGNGCDIASLSAATLKSALVKGGFSFGVDLLASVVPGGAFLSGPAKALLGKISEKM